MQFSSLATPPVRCALPPPQAITALTYRRNQVSQYVARMDAPELATWARSSGLTRDELAMIQPTYPQRPPRFHVRAGVEYRNAGGDDRIAEPAMHIGALTGSARLILPHNRWIGGGIVRVDGSVGSSSDGDLAYDAHLRIGTGFAPMLRFLFHAGITAGVGIDAVGERIARAWTVPVEAFWYVQSSEVTRLGVFGGPTFAIDTDRSRGWSAGLDFVWTRDYEGKGALAPRTIHVGLAAQEIADATFVGLAVSFATRSILGYIPW